MQADLYISIRVVTLKFSFKGQSFCDCVWMRVRACACGMCVCVDLEAHQHLKAVCTCIHLNLETKCVPPRGKIDHCVMPHPPLWCAEMQQQWL
jgi:hypothetical protein